MEFHRFSDKEKAVLKRHAENREPYDMIVCLHFEERGRYKLKEERELASGETEAVYRYRAGCYAVVRAKDERLVGVDFIEGIAAWARESGKSGPTEEMERDLARILAVGENEEAAIGRLGDYYRTLYAEESTDEGRVRYYALHPRCMLKITADENGAIKSHKLLTREQALALFS